jgi:hypothetical protein
MPFPAFWKVFYRVLKITNKHLPLFHKCRVRFPLPELKRQFRAVFTKCGASEKKVDLSTGAEEVNCSMNHTCRFYFCGGSQSSNGARLCHILVPRTRLIRGQQSMTWIENGLRQYPTASQRSYGLGMSSVLLGASLEKSEN